MSGTCSISGLITYNQNAISIVNNCDAKIISALINLVKDKQDNKNYKIITDMLINLDTESYLNDLKHSVLIFQLSTLKNESAREFINNLSQQDKKIFLNTLLDSDLANDESYFEFIAGEIGLLIKNNIETLCTEYFI